MCLEDFLVELSEHIFGLGVVATPDFFRSRLASTLILPALQPPCHPLSSRYNFIIPFHAFFLEDILKFRLLSQLQIQDFKNDQKPCKKG